MNLSAQANLGGYRPIAHPKTRASIIAGVRTPASAAVRCLAKHLVIVALCLVPLLSACDARPPDAANRPKPDIVWVVWDTVRADRLSLYGCDRPTTPHLDEWARQARVFENCVAPGNCTIPSHGSMFTGLLPLQHGADNLHQYLDDAHQTIAELLRASGYATYAYSENPFITKEHNFVQGFDLAEQPFTPKYVQEVNRITWERMLGRQRAGDASAADRPVFQGGLLKAPEVAQRAVEAWLVQQDARQPVFVFVNYMGAHGPTIPAEEYRQRIMKPAHIRRSYRMNRLEYEAYWLFTFGLNEFPPEKIETIRGLYDAAILELDEHFHRLLARLDALGRLENTVVILTSDHGEHIGDRHMYDHQYSVYESLLRVPLVIRHPARIPPGRDDRPVTLVDLFPTLLELAGIDPPIGPRSTAVSLLAPRQQRNRLSECPAPARDRFDYVKKVRPEFDPSPWDRFLRAYYDGPYKFIWGSDGRHELYDVVADPTESRDLIQQQPALATRLAADLQARVDTLERAAETQPMPEISAEQLRRLTALGYAGVPDDGDEPSDDQKRDEAP